MAALRSERSLPPGDKSDTESVAALQAQMKALLDEVELLRQRVERLEKKR